MYTTYEVISSTLKWMLTIVIGRDHGNVCVCVCGHGTTTPPLYGIDNVFARRGASRKKECNRIPDEVANIGRRKISKREQVSELQMLLNEERFYIREKAE